MTVRRSGPGLLGVFLAGHVGRVLSAVLWVGVLGATFARAQGTQTPAPEPPPASPLQAHPAALDLGTVFRGAPRRATVELRNTGAARLRYLGRRDGERAVRVVVSPPQIAPGGRATVSITVATTELRDRGEAAVALAFDGGGRAEIVHVPIRYSAVTVFSLSPRELDLASVHTWSTTTRTLTIVPAWRDEVEVTSVQADRGLTVVPSGKRIVEGRVARQFAIVFRPAGRLGAFRGRVRFHLTSEKAPTVDVWARASVSPDVSVFPSQIEAGTIDRLVGVQLLGTLEVCALGDQPVSVLTVETEGPLQVRVHPPTKPGDPTRVAVALTAQAPERVAGVVRLFLDREDVPVVAVPVTARLVAPVRPEPAALFMDLGRSATIREARVRLLLTPGSPWQIQRVSADAPWLEVAMLPATGGARILSVRVTSFALRDGKTIHRSSMHVSAADAAGHTYEFVVPVHLRTPRTSLPRKQ